MLCVAGWTDGYSDAALRLMEGLDVPRRALIGPWGHNDPVHGVPGPAVGILDELVRWWDRWLKGIDSGIDDDPMVVAYVQEPVEPSANLAERPGRFVGERSWPSPQIVPRSFALGDGTLGVPSGSGTRSIGSIQTVGLEGGAWCADGRSDDLPLDQRVEDFRSLTYDSQPLDAPLELLGFPEARLVLSADRPLALVSVRLCEVLESGASLLVTRGQLNLCHRRSHAEPEPLVPGEEVEVSVQLDAIGHRFAAGQPAPPVHLALLLADRLAVARAGHADVAPRQRRRAARCPSARPMPTTAGCARSTTRRSRRRCPTRSSRRAPAATAASSAISAPARRR